MSSTDPVPRDGASFDVELQREVEQFLYSEASLLDEGRIEEWLDLLTEDVHYWAPTRVNVQSRYGGGTGIGGPDEAALFDDDKAYLRVRLKRLRSGLAWSEDPPSRTTRLVSNVRVSRLVDGELEVESNFVVYRSRLERELDVLAGHRRDLLRRGIGSNGLRIARRTILLDQAVLLAKNLSIFF